MNKIFAQTMSQIFDKMNTQFDNENLIVYDYDSPRDAEYLRRDLMMHVIEGNTSRPEIFATLDAVSAVQECSVHLATGIPIATATKERALSVMRAWNDYELRRHDILNFSGWEEYSDISRF